MESYCSRKSETNLRLLKDKSRLDVISDSQGGHLTKDPFADTIAVAPIMEIEQAESFIDTVNNWPVCMMDAPPSDASRIRLSYSVVSGLGVVCGIFLVQDLFSVDGVLAGHPFALSLLGLLFIAACFIQFNFSYAARTRETIERLREAGVLDPVDEAEYSRIEKQERQIKSCLGLKAFGIVTLVIVSGMIVASPVTGRFGYHNAVDLLPTLGITWFWLLGVQQQPSRAGLYGFVAAGVSLAAGALITGSITPADIFGYGACSIIVGLVINRAGTQNLGWPPIVALFLCRLFTSTVALIVAHLQCHAWTNYIFVENLCTPMVITIGWCIGVLIANAIVNDAAHLDGAGRPAIPNAAPESEVKCIVQKPLADEIFSRAEQLSKQLGSENIAEEYYKKAISLYPYEHRYYCRLGQLYNRHQRYTEAEILFKVATRVSPTHPDAWQSLAALLYNKGEFVQARDACLQALKCPTLTDDKAALVAQCLEDSEHRMKDRKYAPKTYKRAVR